MKKLLDVFWTFFKIGLFTFGGGYAMMPILEKEIIQYRGWMTSSEFIDIFAISEMTPGPVAVNSATFLGYKVGGLIGAFTATLAVVLPSFIIISILYYSIEKFKNSKYVDWIFQGIRPVVLGLIASAAISVARTSLVDIKSVILGIVLFYFVGFKDLNPILAIVISGIVGLIFF